MGALTGPAPVTDDYAVHADAVVLAGVGASASDDYGAFVVASLTSAQATSLALDGVTLTLIPRDTGRGAYRFDGRAGDGVVPAALRSDDADVFLVQFRGPVKAEWRDALDASATAVFDYLPHHSFIARFAPGEADAFAARPEVAFVGPYHAAYKLSPELPAVGDARVTVTTFKDADFGDFLDDAAEFAHVESFASSSAWDDVARVELDASDLARLARHPAVNWIEPALDLGVGHDNADSTAITMTGTIGDWRVEDLGIDGSSQVTSVCDTGVNTSGGSSFSMIHELFADSTETLTLNVPNPAHRKVLMYYAPIENGAVRGDGDDTSGHGTHTAGTVAGDAGAWGSRSGHDGFTVNAKLLVCDITIGGSFQVLNDYANYWNPAYDLGARVNSNSWGQSHTNTYTQVARQHDAYVWDHRDFNVLRSMGNTGPNGNIRPEAVAKSSYGIGATNNGAGAESMASFSTFGPTADNRLKPTVVAPGACLTSSYLSTSTTYRCLSGTSMSTPSVAGAATQVRDYFEKGYYPSGAADASDAINPSHALVRAMLVNSGKEITGALSHERPYSPWLGELPPFSANLLRTTFGLVGTSPDFPNGGQGWGRVLLDDALHFAGDDRKLFVADEGAGLSTGGSATFTVTVTDTTQPLEITLAWADYPGAAGADPAIVNDLDLAVTGPDLLTYNGNVLLDGESVALPFKDSVNVEEGVILKTPAAGTYTIKVTGALVAQGPQPFALVATGGLA